MIGANDINNKLNDIHDITHDLRDVARLKKSELFNFEHINEELTRVLTLIGEENDKNISQ